MGIGGIINFVNVTVHYVQIFLSRNCKFHKIRWFLMSKFVRSNEECWIHCLFTYRPQYVHVYVTGRHRQAAAGSPVPSHADCAPSAQSAAARPPVRTPRVSPSPTQQLIATVPHKQTSHKTHPNTINRVNTNITALRNIPVIRHGLQRGTQIDIPKTVPPPPAIELCYTFVQYQTQLQ